MRDPDRRYCPICGRWVFTMIHDANDPRLIVDFRLRPGCSKVRMHRRGRRDAYRCDACDEQLDLPSL